MPPTWIIVEDDIGRAERLIRAVRNNRDTKDHSVQYVSVKNEHRAEADFRCLDSLDVTWSHCSGPNEAATALEALPLE
jgi:hypothetical protein